MATQSENVNDNDSIVVVDPGTSTVTGPSPPPLDGTTDNNNNNNNNDEEQTVTTTTTTLATTGPPIVLTGLDVAAINKLLAQPINNKERQFKRTWKVYIAQQGGAHAILQRCSDGGDNSSSSNNSSKKKKRRKKRKKKKRKHNDSRGTEDAVDKYDPVAKVMDPSQNSVIDSTGTKDATVAAINKFLTQPINDEERQCIRTIKTYIAEQGGSDAILHRSARGGGGEHHHSSSTGITVGDTTTERVRGSIADPTGTNKDNAAGVLSEILTYLDEKSLIEASFVNKQWHTICHDRSIMEQAIVPYYRLTLDLSLGLDGITNFVRNKKHNFRFRELLKNRYQRFELHLIGGCPIHSDEHYEKEIHNAINATSQIVTKEDKKRVKWYYNKELLDKFKLATDEMTQIIRMDGIVSLVITASLNTRKYDLDGIDWEFSKMFPQLRTINVLDLECNQGEVLDYDCDEFFDGHNPHLTKLVYQQKDRRILWCGIGQYFWRHLKEIYIDDHTFVFDDYENTIETLQFLDYYSRYFTKLERLSIRNARYVEVFENGPWPLPYDTIEEKKLPQHYLIEFVRNAPPALIWLRSDLSQENIKMLKLERPNIDFVN